MMEIAQPKRMTPSKRERVERYLNASVTLRVPAEPPVQARPRSPFVPASRHQQQIWLHAQMGGGIPFYNQTMTVYRSGALNTEVLERCLIEIVRRHEIWRTTFDLLGDQLMQMVQDPWSQFPLETVDLRSLPHDTREAEAVRLATEIAAQPFDLKNGPLLRALVATIEDNRHRLYITVHHIVFDATTAYHVFLPELERLYEAFSAGQPSPLPEPAIQYADFACWDHERAGAGVSSQDLEWWRERLRGSLPMCAWPSDKPRPGLETHRGAIERFHFPPDLVRQIVRCSDQSRTSVYMTCLAGLAALIYRYTGQDDLILGSFSAGRNRPELEGMMGYFVNPLPLRIDLSGNPTFRELQLRVRSAVLGALEHANIPFASIVSAVQPNPDPSRHPLFQIAMAQQPSVHHAAPGWDLIGDEISSGGSVMDLIIMTEHRGDRLFGPIIYNPDLFEPGTIRRMSDHWQNLLETATNNADCRIAELPILAQSERLQVLYEWNAADSPEQDPCIHTWFESRARQTPEAVAVVYEQTSLNYAELNRRANQLAHYLRELGAGPDARVALCLERSLDMIVALLAILKAGGAYVPLDPAHPAERLRYMVNDCDAVALLAHGHLKSIFEGCSCPVIDIAQSDRWRNQPAADPDIAAVGVTPRHLAYIIYTSGSTGAPKGVMIEHRNVARLFAATQAWFQFDSNDVWTLFHSYAFDFSVWEIWGALLYGGRLIIVPQNVSRSPADFYELICREKVTVLNQTPSAFRPLIAAQAGSRKRHRLRYVIFGGEALELATLKPWFEQNRDLDTRLVNMYGLTETAVHVTYKPLEPADALRTGSPIGVRIPDLRTYILDANRQPVPIGVPGELYVGGAGLARGYLNRPDLTAERFLADPFVSDPRARMYKTGDLAKWLPGGTLEYLGRNDFQVKIRGFRIELGEIEARLLECDGIREAVVIAREEGDGDKRLVAYFTCLPGAHPKPEDLRSRLAARLPNYMLPAAYVRMDSFPLTTNGKLDRSALPPPEIAQRSSPRVSAGPRDSLEQMLAQIWAKILKCPRVGRDDNFFDLGGHSLLAVQLMTQIERRFGKRLPLAALIQAPTIEKLADTLRNEQWTPSWSSLVAIRPGGFKPPLFLFHSHRGNVLEYYPLANLLAEDQPVYSLQARGLDGALVKDLSVEEMARSYLKELRELQPEGPYFLGGFCFGGILALEAAHQLTLAGEQVGLVAMIQSVNPATAIFRPEIGVLRRWGFRLGKRLDLERANFRQRGTPYLLERARYLFTSIRGRAELTVDRLCGGRILARSKPSIPYILEYLADQHMRAFAQHRPSYYAGPVVLFRAEKQLKGLVADKQFLGWRDTLRKIDLCEVPGHQQNVLSEPNVGYLAKQFAIRLDAAQRRYRTEAAGGSRFVS